MKPNWLCCEKCLWWAYDEDATKEFKKTSVGYCFHTSQPKFEQGKPNRFNKFYMCEQWTCANCWGGYDAWGGRTAPDDIDWLIDHDKCLPVRFGGDKEDL